LDFKLGTKLLYVFFNPDIKFLFVQMIQQSTIRIMMEKTEKGNASQYFSVFTFVKGCWK